MPTAETASAWVALVVGLLYAATGGLTIASPQSVPLLRKTKWGHARGRRYGLGQLLVAAFFWLEGVPRLADAPSIAWARSLCWHSFLYSPRYECTSLPGRPMIRRLPVAYSHKYSQGSRRNPHPADDSGQLMQLSDDRAQPST